MKGKTPLIPFYQTGLRDRQIGDKNDFRSHFGTEEKKVTRVDKRKNEVTFCMDLYDTGGENTGLASRMESLDQYEGKW